MFKLAFIIIVIVLVGNIIMLVKNLKEAKVEKEEINARAKKNLQNERNNVNKSTSSKKNNKKKK